MCGYYNMIPRGRDRDIEIGIERNERYAKAEAESFNSLRVGVSCRWF